MNSAELRCRGDVEFASQLREEPFVKTILDKLASGELEGPQGVRRRLLGTSVRLTVGMAPEVHRFTDQCRQQLGMEQPLELYVFASPMFNAAAVKPEDDRLFILFSSSLLEGFSGDQLKFVIGHELGHHLYQHHDIPIGYLLNGRAKLPASLMLRLFAWSRYAEISADRAGAACAGQLEAQAHALFKLASGITGPAVTFQLDDFLAQVDDMSQEDIGVGRTGPREDWFSTHPFSPLRVKALQLFNQSRFVDKNGMDKDRLESETQRLMALMEPGYLDENSSDAENLRRLLFAGALVVADAAGGISDKEIEVFERFFGEQAYSKQLNLEKIKQTLDQRIQAVREQAPQTRRTQVLRDLLLIARADGTVQAAERAVIRRIASALEISPAVVDHMLNAPLELD